MYDWDEDEEGEEDDKWTEFTGKNVILFLVDGTEAMQVTDPEDGRTLYQKAVEAACATMKGKKSLFFSFIYQCFAIYLVIWSYPLLRSAALV